MTAEDAAHREIQAANGSIALDGFHGILGAGGCIPAAWGKKRRDKILIPPEQYHATEGDRSRFHGRAAGARLPLVRTGPFVPAGHFFFVATAVHTRSACHRDLPRRATASLTEADE